jgi:hypothetical protein
MKRWTRNWVELRNLYAIGREVDFHWGRRDPWVPYLDGVWDLVVNSVKDAYERGESYVLFTHGNSTSRRGKTTARSMVRTIIRSKEMTPWIYRSKCLQHESVMLVAIRRKPIAEEVPRG